MSAEPFRCVIDANVAVKLFLPQQNSPEASSLFSMLHEQPGTVFHVPDFFYAEFLSGLLIASRHTTYRRDQVIADLSVLNDFVLKTTATRDLSIQAAAIALKHGISGYDAFYVALSLREACPLITADEKLDRGLEGGGFDIRLLSSISF